MQDTGGQQVRERTSLERKEGYREGQGGGAGVFDPEAEGVAFWGNHHRSDSVHQGSTGTLVLIKNETI